MGRNKQTAEQRLQCAEAARHGLERKTAEQKATWLRCYDASLSVQENCDRSGVPPSTYFDWLKGDAIFASEIGARKELLADKRVTDIEAAFVKAACGGFTTVKEIYDGAGKLKEKQEAQQPPSFKHGEMMLRAHAPDVYKPDIEKGAVNIQINLLPAQSAGGVEIADFIDLTSAPRRESFDLFA